jgi:carbon storage regulator
MIGDGVEVRVLRIGRDGVRLGVTAPAAVTVHRREIYDQICEENRTAAGAAVAVPHVLERLRKFAGQAKTQAAPSEGGGAEQPSAAEGGRRV